MFSSVFMTWDRSLLSSNQHEETLFYRVIYWWSTGLPPAQREVLGGSCPSSCCRLWITQGSALNSWTDRCVQHYYYRNNQNTCSVVTAFCSACFLTHQNTATFNMLVQPWRYLSLVVQFNCRPGIQSSSVYIHTWECFLFIVPADSEVEARLNLSFRNHKVVFYLRRLSSWTKPVRILNLCLTNRLFSAIIHFKTPIGCLWREPG